MTRTKKQKQQNFKGSRIMSPIDINTTSESPSKLKGMKDRIESGPLTLVFVYAKWCGHCTEFKPHFEEALRSKNRSVQVVNVDEEKLNKVNEYLKNNVNTKSSINPEGYPSLIIVDKNGLSRGNLPPVKDANTLKKVLDIAGQVDVNNDPKPVVNSTSRRVNINNDPKPVVNSTSQLPEIFSEPNIASLKPLSEESLPEKQEGGTLLKILTETSYQLAPTAILLALASQQFKKHSRSTRRQRSKHRRTTRKQKI